MSEEVKTTEQVTEELNKLLADNNMSLDVVTMLRNDGIRNIVKVVSRTDLGAVNQASDG